MNSGIEPQQNPIIIIGSLGETVNYFRIIIINFVMKTAYSYALILPLMALMSGCQDYDPLFVLSPELSTYFEDSGNFDFSTINGVQLDLDYGPGIGAKALVQVYDQFPDDESTAPPLYSTVTDLDGRIQTNVMLPTYVKEVWLVNHRIGMPEYVQCPVEDGRIVFHNVSLFDHSTSLTRSVDNDDYTDHVKPIPGAANLYTIVSWDDNYGHLNSPLVTTDHDLAGDNYTQWVNNLQYTLWNGKNYKPSGLDNSKYALGSDIVNTKTLSTYIDAEGNEKDVESVSLSLVFMNEWAWNQNVVGYYYYKTGEEPASINDVKRFICLPNASKKDHYPYGGHSDAKLPADEAPAYAGESISLLFEDPVTHKFTKNFPPGYTVGYFVIGNGFNSNKTPGEIDISKNFYYSNEKWNASQTKRYLALSLPNGAIVYGVEDGTGDKSFEDVLFIIKGTPNEAIHNPDIPVINPEEKTIYYWDTYDRTYAFEDIWPDGGDYDLNDIVISHTRDVEFDQDKNLYIVDDIFTLTESFASYNDAFAIQLHKDYLDGLTVTCDGVDITNRVRKYDDAANDNAKTLILFDDLQQVPVGTVMHVERKFAKRATKPKKDEFETAENGKLNPFVVSRFSEADYLSGNMVEIHIPNHGNRTCKGLEDRSTGSEYYYVAHDGEMNYPFALELPVKHFKPSPEGVVIDQTYPRFSSWVKSNGVEEKDWYHQVLEK